MGASTGVAPVCNVNPPPQQFQTNPVYIPSVPPVVPTLASVVAAINVIRTGINVLNPGNYGPGGNGGGNGGRNGRNGNNGGGGNTVPPPAPPTSNFKVTKQNIQKVKIYDPNDPTGQTYVVVDQVTSLDLQNPISKQGWSWTQPGNLP
jgi:hypothetical protein